VQRKIDQYEQIIEARLAEHCKLSATQLYEEIWAAGYAGSYSRVPSL
jgi:hypothetical protein